MSVAYEVSGHPETVSTWLSHLDPGTVITDRAGVEWTLRVQGWVTTGRPTGLDHDALARLAPLTRTFD